MTEQEKQSMIAHFERVRKEITNLIHSYELNTEQLITLGAARSMLDKALKQGETK